MKPIQHVTFASFAFFACVVAVATSSCGWLPKKVTEKECNAWGDKFSKLLKDAADVDMAKCLEDKGIKSDVAGKGAAMKAMDEAIGEQARALVKGCSDQAGRSYVAKDADCYMRASKMADWKSCSFETPFFKDFVTLADSFDRDFLAACEKNSGKPGENAGKKDDADE